MITDYRIYLNRSRAFSAMLLYKEDAKDDEVDNDWYVIVCFSSTAIDIGNTIYACSSVYFFLIQ